MTTVVGPQCLMVRLHSAALRPEKGGNITPGSRNQVSAGGSVQPAPHRSSDPAGPALPPT